MKKNLQKLRGFTLIELMVTISIIGTLSSAILANLSEARRKTEVVKTVQDLKSLQNAIEIYRLQNDTVPGEAIFDSSGNLVSSGPGGSDVYAIYGMDRLSVSSLTLLLSPVKYISKIPHAPGWPRNYLGPFNYSYVFYTTEGERAMKAMNSDYIYYCGDKPVDKYMIAFFSKKDKLDLPRASKLREGDPIFRDIETNENVKTSTNPGTYCFSG